MQASSPWLSTEEWLALMGQDTPEEGPKSPIKLVFADPHPVVLEGLKKSFSSHPDFGVNGGLTDGDSAWRAVSAYRPDVLIMELTLTDMSSMQLIRTLRDLSWPTKVIVFSLTNNPLWSEALVEGVHGLVSKNKADVVLMDCVRAVHTGQRWLDEEFTVLNQSLENQKLESWALESRLTQREQAVVKALMRGVSNRIIAKELAIEEGTVKTHLKHIYRKLGCSNRVELLSRTRN